MKKRMTKAAKDAIEEFDQLQKESLTAAAQPWNLDGLDNGFGEEDAMTPRDVLIAYLKMKVDAGDWHAVADAAMDLRELEAKW